jgi:hypothetical protein
MNVDMLSENINLSYAVTVQGFGGGGGGGGFGVLLTQHLMSVFPGQNPVWKVPSEQPLFLTLRQYPEPAEGTLQVIFTQHYCGNSAKIRRKGIR